MSGWAGAGRPGAHDLVILIDVSGSTAYASGTDIDGDGLVGRRRSAKREAWRHFDPSFLSTDAGDTILAAELLATKHLVERIGGGRTRIGLVSFSSEPRIAAPLGSDTAALEEALEKLDRGFGSGGTNMARALTRATDALVEARAEEAERQQAVLILSDGDPTLPEGSAAQATRDAASRAGRLGIRIYSFELGFEAGSSGVYASLAELSDGGHVRLAQPGQIVYELGFVNLTEVAEILIHNVTHERPARAIRVFPDGSFDGLVPLEPGENRIRVEARGIAGGHAVEERVIVYRPEDAGDATGQVEAFKEKLRSRTIETELARRRRKLEVEVEP